MSVTYNNNWKNIITALSSKLKSEMKCPIFSDFYDVTKSNQFIKLIPTGSIQGDVTSKSEVRVFNIDIQYYIMEQKNKNFQDYVFNQVSILEALVHDNPTLTLSDGSKAYNLLIGDLELSIDPPEEYEEYNISGWNFKCTHLSNLG